MPTATAGHSVNFTVVVANAGAISSVDQLLLPHAYDLAAAAGNITTISCSITVHPLQPLLTSPPADNCPSFPAPLVVVGAPVREGSTATPLTTLYPPSRCLGFFVPTFRAGVPEVVHGAYAGLPAGVTVDPPSGLVVGASCLSGTFAYTILGSIIGGPGVNVAGPCTLTVQPALAGSLLCAATSLGTSAYQAFIAPVVNFVQTII